MRLGRTRRHDTTVLEVSSDIKAERQLRPLHGDNGPLRDLLVSSDIKAERQLRLLLLKPEVDESVDAVSTDIKAERLLRW